MGNGVIVDRIEWDNIYLEFYLQNAERGSKYYLRNLEKGYEIPLTESDDCIRINITNISAGAGCRMLETGEYEFVYEREDEKVALPISNNVFQDINKYDRIFPYGKNRYAYLVKLKLTEEHTCIGLILSVAYMRRNKKEYKEYKFLDCENWKEAFKEVILEAVIHLFKLEYRILNKLYYNKQNNILLMSETKDKIAGNLRSIDRHLKEKHTKWRISYSFHEILNLSTMKMGQYWWKLIPLLAKQRIILVDDYCPIFKYIDLSQRTKLIQVWHAGVGFKSVGYSRFGKEDSPNPHESCHRKYDYVVVGSERLIPVYEEVFGLPKEKFLAFGLARIDDYMKELEGGEYKNIFFEKYPELEGKKIIVFAPTYRGGGQNSAYYPYEKLNIEALYNLCGEKYVFLFKMHPFIKVQPNIPRKCMDKIINVSDEDMNQILQITDILITDYSSVIYEFALLRKPMVFYAFDRIAYGAMRGFHWDYEKYAPGKVCDNFEDLVRTIKEGRFENERLEEFIDFGYQNVDGHSSDRLVEFLDKI